MRSPKFTGGTRCRASSASIWKNSRPISTPRRSEYRIVPTYKGNYTETVTASIFAFRSRSQPAIVQVNEIATATMMAASGAIYPVFELMRDQTEEFSPSAYLPAVTGYYSDVAGNMLSFPFNASTPILYYNKDMFRAAGLDPASRRRKPGPRSVLRRRSCARRARLAASPRRGRPGSMSRIFPHSTMCRSRPSSNGFGGLDAELTFNNPLMVRHIAQLAEWQATKVFDYSGRGAVGRAALSEGRMRHLHRLVGDARRHQGQFEIRGRLRHAAVLARRGGRAAKHHHRRRHAVGAARPAARRIHAASQSSLRFSPSPRCRRPGTRTRAICRSPARPTS